MNNSEEEYMPNQSLKSMLDPNKERKLIKVDFSALARLVVCQYNNIILLKFVVHIVYFLYLTFRVLILKMILMMMTKITNLRLLQWKKLKNPHIWACPLKVVIPNQTTVICTFD